MFIQNLLLILMGLPVIGGFSLLLFPKRAVRQMKLFALNVSLLNFLVSLNLWIFFDNSAATPNYNNPGRRVGSFLENMNVETQFGLLTFKIRKS